MAICLPLRLPQNNLHICGFGLTWTCSPGEYDHPQLCHLIYSSRFDHILYGLTWHTLCHYLVIPFCFWFFYEIVKMLSDSGCIFQDYHLAMFHEVEIRRRLKRYVWVLSSQALKWIESGHCIEAGVLANVLVYAPCIKICTKVTGSRCHSRKLCGGMEITCRLVISCWVKINRLKELLTKKNRKWTQWWKRQWSTTTCFQFVIRLFSDIFLRSFVWRDITCK